MVVSLSCLQRGQRFKAEGCQSTGAMHPWYSGAPGNKFDLASAVYKQTKFAKNVGSMIVLILFLTTSRKAIIMSKAVQSAAQ